jgi:EAL domain-containing protein (putative c-di-GMP-specific phosphodiesterase class I)
MDVRLHEHEADRVASLHSYGVLDVGRDPAFDAMTRTAALLCSAPMAALSLVDRDRQWLLSAYGLPVHERPREESVCSDVIAAGRPLTVRDLTAVPRYAGVPGVGGPDGARGYAAVLLTGRDGLPLGTLCVFDTRPRLFDADDLARLEDVAQQATTALELRRVDAATGLTSPDLVADAHRPQSLRRALDAGEFVPHFQPLVDLRDGVVTGLEALVRWQHPTHGLLTPASFLPGLEAGTLSACTTRTVLTESLRVVADLRSRGIELPDGVGVNLSGQQFAGPGLSRQVLGLLDATGLPGSALTLEITETTEIADVDLARDELLVLREAGVHVAADDYGVGWSNLVRLLRLPVSGLKIDRALVTGLVGDPVREHMVASAVALGATMGLSVLAEGVETEAVRGRLLELGCRRGQGWLFGAALPAADLPARLRRTHPAPAADDVPEGVAPLVPRPRRGPWQESGRGSGRGARPGAADARVS